MTYTLHVTVNYPDCEKEHTHRGIIGIRELGDVAKGYLKEGAPSSWVFVVTREESND